MGIIKDPTSWRTGFELGLAGFSFPYSKPRKPTAYLYNGIRLPALPEWDRKMYPYAVITGPSSGSGNYYLYCTDTYVKNGKVGAISRPALVPTTEGKYLYCSAVSENLWDEYGGEWTKQTELTLLANYGTTYAGVVVWSNFDLYDTEDTLHMAASEPIPVYE